MRLKCALLGLTTLKVALHRAKGTPLPDGLAGFDELELSIVAELEVAPADELPPGSVEARHGRGPGRFVGVYNCGGHAVRDRGPLLARRRAALRGRLGPRRRARVVCPRHGSAFELATGQPLSLPAYEPVATYPVRIVDGIVRVDVD